MHQVPAGHVDGRRVALEPGAFDRGVRLAWLGVSHCVGGPFPRGVVGEPQPLVASLGDRSQRLQHRGLGQVVDRDVERRLGAGDKRRQPVSQLAVDRGALRVEEDVQVGRRERREIRHLDLHSVAANRRIIPGATGASPPTGLSPPRRPNMNWLWTPREPAPTWPARADQHCQQSVNLDQLKLYHTRQSE